MAMILDAFVSKFSDLLADLVRDEVALLLGVPDDIKKLQRTLGKIGRVLADAERRRIEDAAVADWLKELKDVMYDADDILDHCQIEAKRRSAAASSSQASNKNQSSVLCCPSVSLFSCFRNPKFAHEIGNKIKTLNVRLEEISNEKEKFSFDLKLPVHDEYSGEISNKTSSVVESDIVGSKIEEDTQSLVELLTRLDTRAEVLVVAVVGIGGVGKTTLAQKIFDDETIKDLFPLNMWLCVSEEFTEVNLLRDLISCAGGSHDDGSTNRTLLEDKLVDAVRGRKFLLVLDDVWTDRAWDGLLRNPLRSGAAGSRILVTSRNEGVAKQMKAVYIHRVELLSPEDGWSLLRKKVLLDGEDEVADDLKEIGIAIVNKCDGLPLAIKAIGGVLCKEKRMRSCWDSVLKSTAWSMSGLPEEVNRALHLSYMHLPSPIKQCFIHCSLYPEDHTLHMAVLVRVWIAEGFVKAQGTLSMEEVGQRYYRELISRNLLLPDPAYHSDRACRMHDLLRSLAQFLAQDESLTVGKGQELSSSADSMKLRRLTIVNGEMLAIHDVLRIKDSLRTLMLFKNRWSSLNGLFDHLCHLRTLVLMGRRITELPDSLFNLVHLRCLVLNETSLTILPEAVSNLTNLLFLDLDDNKNLCQLPNSIVKLDNLRTLDLRCTSVNGMPTGFGRLKHLNSLCGFKLHQGTSRRWCTLDELQPLSQLGKLTIENLECASGCSEAKGAALFNKTHLLELKMECKPKWLDAATKDDIKRIEKVFDELRPPSCIEFLEMKGYPGSMFPSWMKVMATTSTLILSNLTRLCLSDWSYCRKLPPLGKLPNLVNLWIEKLPRVKSIGLEFLGIDCIIGTGGLQVSTSFTSFPKLKKLGFEGMASLEEWQWKSEARAMPCLETLILDRCPKLASLPNGLISHAAALSKLLIYDAENLKLVEKFVWLTELKVFDSPNLMRVSDLPNLKSLSVKRCPGLKEVENLPSLHSIQFTDYKMDSLPEWLSEGVCSAKPEKLEIHCREKLIRRICLKEKRQEWSKIQHISRVSIYYEDIWVHYSKTPFGFTTNLSEDTNLSPNSNH